METRDRESAVLTAALLTPKAGHFSVSGFAYADQYYPRSMRVGGPPQSPYSIDSAGNAKCWRVYTVQCDRPFS